MRSQTSLLQIIGFFLCCSALGFLIPIFAISLNPFRVAPFWIVLSVLSVLLIGLVLSLLMGRFTPQFKPTRFQWLGIGVLSLVLFMGTYLLSTHGTHVSGAFSVASVIVIVFGMRIVVN